MRTPSDYDTEPFKAYTKREGTGGMLEEFDGEWEEFLGTFWKSFSKPRIEDRTAFTPKNLRKEVRDIKKVYALVLHHMAFSRGSNSTRYDTVNAHFAILPDGTILQLHPETALLWASHGFNTGSVAVEFAGNFPNTSGQCWRASTYGCHKLTSEQIEAGRYLVEYLIEKIGLTHILAHRQANEDRENDPGPDIWYNVGQWAIEKYGLNDGGPGFKIDSGNPIPDTWRNWGRMKKEAETAWEMFEEFDEGELYDEAFAEEEEFSLSAFPESVLEALRNGLESVAVKLAIANGQRDENDLTNLIFFNRHRERNGGKLLPGEPNFDRLDQEWREIRDRLVRPALQQQGGKSPTPSKPVETFCTPVNPRGKNEDLLMKSIVPYLQKYRGDIPIDFLLGWVAVESAGYIEATTRECERGYFQLHPEEARRVGVDDPQLLSTNPEYSVKMGIEMVKQKMARAEELGFARGSDLNRHFAKLLHWLPAYVPILVNVWNASKSSPRTWKGFSDFVANNRDEIVRTMAKQYPRNGLLDILKTKPGASNADPVHGIMGVDKVFALGPFWAQRLRKAGVDTEYDSEFEVKMVGGIPEPDYLRWVQRSLNRYFSKYKIPITIDVNGNDTAQYREAVKRFKAHTRLTPADSTVDERTQNNLIIANEADATYMAWVQTELKKAGARSLTVTGKKDTNTTEAIKAFQRYGNGRFGFALVDNGFMGAKTELALHLATLEPPKPSVVPLPPLTAEEESALRKLPASDQALFSDLRKLIVTYKGVARTEADKGSRTLLRRGAFQTVSKLLAEISELTKITTLFPGWSIATAKPLLVGNVLYNLAFPETINQGGTDRLGGQPDPTCFSASTQMLLARRFPATYVRMVRQMATTGICFFAGGSIWGPLKFVSTSLYKSLDSVLLQTAFDTYFHKVAFSGGNDSAGNPTYQPGDELTLHRQVFGASRPPKSASGWRSSDIVSKFRRAFVTSGGTIRPPEIINLCTGNPSVSCGNHCVVLTRVVSGRVYFYNPWANEEERNTMFGAARVTISGNGERPAESSMSQSDFENQLTTVFYN